MTTWAAEVGWAWANCAAGCPVPRMSLLVLWWWAAEGVGVVPYSGAGGGFPPELGGGFPPGLGGGFPPGLGGGFPPGLGGGFPPGLGGGLLLLVPKPELCQMTHITTAAAMMTRILPQVGSLLQKPLTPESAPPPPDPPDGGGTTPPGTTGRGGGLL